MAHEGIKFLRQEIRNAKTDEERLSATIVLDQLLLLTDKRQEYAEHVVEELLPLAAKVFPNAGPNRDAVSGAVAITLFPLAIKEFSDQLPEKLVRTLSAKMDAVPHRDDDIDFASQAVLNAFGLRLNDTALIERADARLAKHPAKSRWSPAEKREVDTATLRRIRIGFILPELLAEAFGQ